MKRNSRNSFRSRTLGIAGALALCFSATAQADAIDGIIDTWQVDVSTIFDTASICDSTGDCTAPTGVTVIDNQTLRWGSSTGQGVSGLQISNSPASGNVLTNGAAVNNISITHLNRPITGTTLSSVDILSTLTLTPVSPAGSALPPVTITFGVDYLETDNGATPCADGGINGVGVNVNGCADIYVTDVKSLNFGFTYDFDGAGSLFGDQTYYISFFEATNGLNTLSADACAAVGASYPCLGFETPEGQDTTVNFASLITTEKVVINVPEPSTLALGGLGLVALAGLRRRN